MLLVLGKEQCARCDMVKRVLSDRGVAFDYQKLSDYPNIIKKAREAGIMEAPVLVSDDVVVSFKDFISSLD